MGESSRVVSFEPLLPHSAVSNSTAATAGNTGCSSRTGPTAARRNGTKGRAMINDNGLYALCSQKYQPWNRETRRTFLPAKYAIFEGNPISIRNLCPWLMINEAYRKDAADNPETACFLRRRMKGDLSFFCIAMDGRYLAELVSHDTIVASIGYLFDTRMCRSFFSYIPFLLSVECMPPLRMHLGMYQTDLLSGKRCES